MNPDTELDAWRRHWQTQETIPPGLREKVERDTREQRQWRRGEIVITMILGGGSLGWALMSRRQDSVVLAVGIWILIGIAWALSLAFTRNTWAPVAATTAAFLELSILRCRRDLYAVGVQAVLYVVIVAFDLVWLYSYRPAEAPDWLTLVTSWPAVIIWLISAVLAVVAVRYAQRLRRELANLARLREDLTSS